MKIAGRVEIASAATWIPEDFELPPAYDGLGVLDFGLPLVSVKSLPVSHELAAPEMAVRAARDCLKQAECASSSLHALYHSHLYHQGHDYWSAAHYIARQLETLPHTTPVTFQQACNGAVASMEVAAATLLADPGAGPILLTTADRFIPPGWLRWAHPGKGMPSGFGDGATALLLRRRGDTPTTLALLSVTQISDPSLEEMYRGEPDFTPAPMWQKAVFFGSETVDQKVLVDAALGSKERVRQCLMRALADAEVEPADRRIRYVLLPRGDAIAVGAMYCGAFDGIAHAEVLILGEHTGHLGPGDPIANIAELRDRGMLQPGEIAVLVAGGGGTTWSTIVVEAGSAWQR